MLSVGVEGVELAGLAGRAIGIESVPRKKESGVES